MLRKVLPILAGFSVLCLVVAAVLTRHVQAQVTMKEIGLPNRNLILIGPSDPGFNDLLKSLLSESTPELDALKAYAVILQNNSRNSVVAYSLRWEYTNPDGKRVHVDLSDRQIMRLMDGPIRKTTTEYDKVGPTIDPRSSVVVTPPTILKTSSGASERAKDANYQTFLQKLVARLGQGHDVTVTLDGAFFEDGSFVGPNKTRLFENFSAEVRAHQNLVRAVVAAAQQGRNMEDVAREIEASLPDSRPKLTRVPDGTLSGYDEYYRYKYASRFLSVYRNSSHESALAWTHSHLIQNPPKLINLDSKEVTP